MKRTVFRCAVGFNVFNMLAQTWCVVWWVCRYLETDQLWWLDIIPLNLVAIAYEQHQDDRQAYHQAVLNLLPVKLPEAPQRVRDVFVAFALQVYDETKGRR